MSRQVVPSVENRWSLQTVDIESRIEVLSRACASLRRPNSEKSETDSHDGTVVELPDPIGLKAGTPLTGLRCQGRLIST